jgi:hypothetical protein
MAQFYADIEGNRSPRTCMGTKSSGIEGHVRGWNIGGRVNCYYCEVIDGDYMIISVSSGSNGRYDAKNLGNFCRDRAGELVDYIEYKEKIAKLKDEFLQLHSDDIAFRRQYKKKEFWSWYEDQGKL